MSSPYEIVLILSRQATAPARARHVGAGKQERSAAVSGSQSLQVVGEPLDLPAEGLPLEQECANHLRRAPGAQALDLVAENVPVASGLAQYRIESLVQLLEGRGEVRVELVNGAAPQRGL